MGNLPPCQQETSHWNFISTWGNNPTMEDLKRQLLIERIKEGLAKKDIKPKPAALAMGLSETAILDILKGRSQNPKRNTLQTMAEYFDMPLDYLMGSPPLIPELQTRFADIAAQDEIAQKAFANIIGAAFEAMKLKGKK